MMEWRLCLLLLLVALVPPARAAMFERATLPAPAGRVNHAPGLIELKDGELLACWYSGSTEANADSEILCAQSADAGLGWTAPRRVAGPGEKALGAREANKSLGNVALARDGAGRIWLFNGAIQRWEVPLLGNLCLNWSCGRVDARLSTDEGQSWSAPVRFDDRVGALPRARPLHLPGLGDLVPVYLENDRSAAVRLLDLAGVSPGRVPASRLLPIPGTGVIQPSLVALPDGTVRAYLRDSNSVAIRTARLDPVRAAWSPLEPTDLPNPDSGLDAFLAPGEGIVVVFNPSTRNRHALALAASTDGVHFSRRCLLVPPGPEGDVAYPAALRTSDGTVHILYSAHDKQTIQHIRFDLAWLRTCLGG